MNKGQLLAALGGAGLIIGALLPWASLRTVFGTIGVSGYEGDGMITGGIGLLILIAALLHKGKAGKRYSIGSAIFGFIVGLIVLWEISRVGEVVTETSSEYVYASVGAGLYLSAVAALLVFIGGLQRLPRAEEA